MSSFTCAQSLTKRNIFLTNAIKAVSEQFGRGEKIHPEHLDRILEFLSVFVDKCHHGKEEEFLFPALVQAGNQKEGALISVLLDEHAEGRVLVAKLNEAVGRFQSGDRAASRNFESAALAYISLLTQHIEKENNILFEASDAKLGAPKDNEIFKAFEQLERERIGPGKHEEFHALLHRLEHEYLNKRG